MTSPPPADVAALVDAARALVARHEAARTPSPSRLDELVRLLAGPGDGPGHGPAAAVRSVARQERRRTTELADAVRRASPPAPPSAR